MSSHPVPVLDEVRPVPSRAGRSPGRRASAPVPPPAIAIRIPLRLAGMLLLGLCAVLLVSLASWSVDDPSLSLATEKSPANWLGYPGAVIADLAFQFLGLAGLVMAVPPVLWGWAMARRFRVSRTGLRLLCWLGATVLFAGVFAFIAMPASWPLPTGLGGLAGMLFANLAALIAGDDPQPVTSTLFAIILAAPALALLWIAMGLGTAVPAGPPKTGAGRREAAGGEPADEREPNPLVEVALGALVHAGYSLRTAFRRARADYLARREAEHEGRFAEPSLDGAPTHESAGPPMAPQRRIHVPVEPSFAPAPRGMEEAGYDDTAIDYPDEDDDIPFTPDVRQPPRTQRGDSRFHPVDHAAPRVTAPAPRPAPGQRVFREAQGSLLDEPAGFELPELSLLSEPRRTSPSPEHAPERLEEMARQLEAVLQDFGVKGDIINVRPGPVVTLFELEPAPGIKSSRVISLADDIARSMSAISARVAVVPGRNAIGIELPNKSRETVYFREMLASSDFEKMKGKLPICLGKTIGGEPVIADLARMPHLLIAGTTGSGKSVGINTFILSLLYQMTPEQCRMIMIDPKMLELSIYDGIPHLLTPVVTDPQKAVVALKWAVREMEDRYRKMSKIGVRNIDGFNQRVTEAAAEGKTITRTVQTGFDRETGEAIFESEEFDLEPLP